MGIFIFRWRRIMLVSLLGALAFGVVACGEDDSVASQPQSTTVAATSVPAPASTATTPPTATQVVIKVTPVPIPTETPVPTPTEVPPTPTVVIDTEALYDVGPERPFPDELLGSTDHIDRDEAAIVWDTFLGDTRVIGELSGPNILDLCSDHTGKWLIGSDRELKPLTGMTFT